MFSRDSVNSFFLSLFLFVEWSTNTAARVWITSYRQRRLHQRMHKILYSFTYIFIDLYYVSREIFRPNGRATGETDDFHTFCVFLRDSSALWAAKFGEICAIQRRHPEGINLPIARIYPCRQLFGVINVVNLPVVILPHFPVVRQGKVLLLS